MNTNAKSELKNRVEKKKLELQAKIEQFKADAKKTAREDKRDFEQLKERVSETVDQDLRDAEAKLDELRAIVGERWENFSDKVAGKLDSWLSNS